MRSFHQSFVPLLAAGLLLAAAVTAQTPARAWVLRGCNNPAPTDSLMPRGTAPGPVRLPNANGVVVAEIESIPTRGSWAFRNSRAGFTGTGYFRWVGPNLFSSPGRDILTYRVWIEQAGTYQVRIHNRHDNSDPSEENDCWMRANGGRWTKTYSNDGRNSNVWNWHFRFDPGHGAVQYRLNAGVNTIEISGRSNGFMIDRLTVFPWGAPGGEDVNTPQSKVMGYRPVTGKTFTLHAGDPNDEAGLDRNNTMAVLLASLGHSRCNSVVPGFGPNGGPGDLHLRGAVLPFSIPVQWGGPTRPAVFDMPVPNDPALVGARGATQGVLYETSSRARTVLTDGVAFEIGAL